ncbi:MAG: TonB-dependent receptor [Prevotellaceae bacterium]|nr:TonB-dependent receptor [Prevotellaceae bacterium]
MNFKLLPHFLFSTFALSTSAVAQLAQDSLLTGDEMEEVIITGNKGATLTATPVLFISTKEKDRLGVSEISEALKRTAGVELKDYGGVGGLKTISVRSLGSQHTAVTYDGVALTDCQNGQIDLSRYSLDNLDKMTLTIGEGNDIFRPARHFASASILDLYTPTPTYDSTSYHLSARIKAGSFGLANPSFAIDKKTSENSWCSISGDYLRSDGRYPYTLTNGENRTREKRSNSEMESFRCEANFNSKIGKRSFLKTKIFCYDSDRKLPGSIILYNTNNKEQLRDKNCFSQIQFRTYWNSGFSLLANGKFNWAATFYHDEGKKYPDGEINDRYFQREYYASAALLFQPTRPWTFAIASDYALNGLNSNLSNCVYPKRHTLLNVLSAQYSTRKVTATATGLYSVYLNETKIGETPHNKKRLSPALSISYKPFKPEFRIRASYKDIFRMPTFNELYFDRSAIKRLNPERARQINIGSTYQCTPSRTISNFQITLDGYHNDVKDKIVAIPRMFTWSMINMGEVDINGIDIQASASFSVKRGYLIFLSGNYALQKAIDQTDKSTRYYGDQIPYTPRHAGGGSAAFENPYINISYQINAVGKRYCLPENKRDNRIDAYIEHSLSLYRNMKLKNVEFSVRGDLINFTDCQYEVIKYYPMPGRSYRISLYVKSRD